MIQWHKSDLVGRMYLNIEGGKKISMPRYYKDKLYSEDERKRIGFFAAQLAEEKLEKYWNELFELYGDDAIRVKVEQDKFSFIKMHKDAEKNRSKI